MMSGKRKKRGLERGGLDLLQWCSDAPKHSLWKLLNSSEDAREKNWKTFHMKAWEDASSCGFNLWTESYCRRGDVPFELGYGKTKLFIWLYVCVEGRRTSPGFCGRLRIFALSLKAGFWFNWKAWAGESHLTGRKIGAKPSWLWMDTGRREFSGCLWWNNSMMRYFSDMPVRCNCAWVSIAFLLWGKFVFCM